MQPRSQTLVSNIGIRMMGLRLQVRRIVNHFNIGIRMMGLSLQVRRIVNPFPKYNIQSRNFFQKFMLIPFANGNALNVKFLLANLCK